MNPVKILFSFFLSVAACGGAIAPDPSAPPDVPAADAGPVALDADVPLDAAGHCLAPAMPGPVSCDAADCSACPISCIVEDAFSGSCIP